MKLILDLCGGTGAWSAPYKEAGYDVINITLPKYDVRTYRPPENVYGVLAAPPCTMFSFARTNAKIPRNLDQGMELVIVCLKIIWKVKPKFWALENPTGYLRRFLGLPVLRFHPYEFGDPYKKKTDLWGYFNLPKKKPIEPIVAFNTAHNKDWHHQGYFRPKGMSRTEFRSITPRGFALAFFKANK